MILTQHDTKSASGIASSSAMLAVIHSVKSRLRQPVRMRRGTGLCPCDEMRLSRSKLNLVYTSVYTFAKHSSSWKGRSSEAPVVKPSSLLTRKGTQHEPDSLRVTMSR